MFEIIGIATVVVLSILGLCVIGSTLISIIYP